MIYPLIRRLLFCLEPEQAHQLALSALQWTPKRFVCPATDATSPVQAMGLHFPNRLGIAAGLDKNADYLTALEKLDCGFLEVGSITPLPQPGNPTPRLFRLPEHHAIINRMGFNNKGIDHLIDRVSRFRRRNILGINIGKNLATAVEDANRDYNTGLQRAYPYADYITVNISSPNTPGLRMLQSGDQLHSLLSSLKACQLQLAQQHSRYVPLVIKISPDMPVEDINVFCDAVQEHHIDAVMATNTTLSRKPVESHKLAGETGGLSGAPIAVLARETISQLAMQLPKDFTIIGCGGIDSAEDAIAHCRAGATLVQVYSGFIYRGPPLLRDIKTALAEQHNTPSQPAPN